MKHLLLWIVGLTVLVGTPAFSTAAGSTNSVLLNAQYADRGERPERFGPDKGPGLYIEDSRYVQNIHWTSWGSSEASGTGRVSRLTGNATSAVNVTLGGLTSCGGQMVYTTYSLTLAPSEPTPKYWAQGQTGTFPCHITAAHFNPYDHGERAAAGRGDCTFNGLVKLGSYAAPVAWKPQPPRGGAYFGLCRMAWHSWGGVTANVTAIMRNGFRQWPATAQLSGLAWCQSQALAYTTLAVTLYGGGEQIPPHPGSVTKLEANHLLRAVRRRNISRHVYRQTLAGCEPAS